MRATFRLAASRTNTSATPRKTEVTPADPYVGALARRCAPVILALLLGCGKPSLRFPLERTPARLERGNYLANAVAICFHCHSERDWEHSPGGLPAFGRL